MNTDPNPSQPTPTRQQVAVAIVRELSRTGWSLDEITAFLVAEDTDGVLRENCPAWKRQTYLFLLTHGRLYQTPQREHWRAYAEEHLAQIRWAPVDA